MGGRTDKDLADLMRAALGGDERAYGRFLGEVAGMVRGFARRKAAHGVDAEDVVQETLLAIHAKRHTWRTDAPVLPWVFAIARFKLIDEFRRRGRRRHVDLDEVADSLAQPEAESLTGREVAQALAGLTPGQRDAVSAISVEGRTITETARRHGTSEVAVRVAFHRGLSAITKRFGSS